MFGVITPTSTRLPYASRAFRYGQLRGVGHPQLVPWLQRLLTGESHLYNAATVVYKRRPNLVCVTALPAHLDMPWPLLVVKCCGWRGRQHYLFSPLKRSKALKAYRAACHLLAHGLGTPLPLGACEVRRWGFIRSNIYVAEAITDYITLREYCATLPDGAAGLDEVMRLAAAYTRRMHDSGLWHRDLSLANFLMTGPRGNRQLYLVDLNRARRLPYMPAWLRALDLARMDWRAWQPRFLVLYGAGRFGPQRLLWLAQLHSRWRTWRYGVLSVINPLRRRLGLK